MAHILGGGLIFGSYTRHCRIFLSARHFSVAGMDQKLCVPVISSDNEVGNLFVG